LDARRNLGFLLTNAGKFDEAANEYKLMLQFAEKDRAFNSFKKAQMPTVLANSHANAKQFPQAIEGAEAASFTERLFLPLFGQFCKVGKVHDAVCCNVCGNTVFRARPKPSLSQSRQI